MRQYNETNIMTSEDNIYFALFKTIDDEDLIQTWMVKSLRQGLRLYMTVADLDWDLITESILQHKPNIDIYCFLEDFHEKINWDIISSQYQYLSLKFINNFHRYLNWSYVSRCQKLSEKIIRKYYQVVDWKNISQFQSLSEKFIAEFQYYVDWYLITKHQTLSPEFIERYEDAVDWNNIVKYQNYFV